MCDLLAHSYCCDPCNVLSDWADHISNINAYNAATGNNCTIISYEGGYFNGCTNTCTVNSGPRAGMSIYGYGNITPAWNHDIQYDPVWGIYEKDFYGLLQDYGFEGLAIYSRSLYYFYQTAWGAYHYVGQPYGKGDGSDGKANNRLWFVSPEFAVNYAGTASTNQDLNCVSVRGQSHVEWMGDTVTATDSGPTSGLLGSQSTAFTVSLNQPAAPGGVTVTPVSTNGSDTFQAASGGSNVSSVAIPAGSTSVTFYLTPGGTAGNRSISITTSPSLTYSGSPITYSAAAVPTAATLAGPSTGFVGVQSTAFTVTVNQPAAPGGVTVTPVSTNGSDTFQAGSGGSNVSSVAIPAGSTSVTFYLTPGGTAGNRSISITTSPSLSYSGSPITYPCGRLFLVFP